MVSLGLNVAFDPTMLRSTAKAAEDATAAATVEQAAKVIDLSTLPLAEGAKDAFGRHVGMVSYEVASDSKTAFQFHQKQLTKLGWKELPGATSQAQYLSANFQKEGFTLTVSSYAGSDPTQPKSAMVSITNLGNVRLSKLPTVKGAKQLLATDANASYSTTLKSAEAISATRKLLTDAGWEPYGTVSNPPESEVMTFKRNAVRLTAFVGDSPAQKGLVMISYSSGLLAADIPAPANAKDVGFDDAQKVLQFQSPDTFDDVAKFYQQRLVKMGWKPDSKELSKSKYSDDRPLGELRFQNANKDSLLLQLTEEDGTTHARLSLKTAADIAALQKQLKAATEKLAAQEKASKDGEDDEDKPATKPRKKVADDSDDDVPDVNALIKGAVGDALKDGDVDLDKLTKGLNAKVKGIEKEVTKGASKTSAKDAVSIPIPDGVKKVDQTRENVLQIKLPAGKGKATAELIRDQLLAAEWESEDDDKLTAKSGNLTLNKGRQKVTMSYVDTGFSDVNLMLIGFGAKLEQGKVDPNAKVPVASSKPKPKSDDDDTPEDEPKPSKKTAKKKSKSDSSESSAKQFVEPKRVEKPSRGIAKLDKLPNEGLVSVDNLGTDLPHVVAFEAVSGGRWVTRVVASEKPIKQDMLIEWMKSPGKSEEIQFPASHVQLELDDQDRPNRLSMLAGQFSLGSSGGDLEGDAIVEDGRARGSFRMKMPKDVFDKQFLAEISFDVPVLTRNSQPAKQLADAKKLETSGKVVVDNQPKKLSHVIAYQVKSGDEIRTAVLFNEKPINVAKLKEALAKNGNDDGVIDFSSQVKVYIARDDRPAFLNLYTDGVSLNQNTNLVGDVIVEDLRARGTVKFDKPVEFFGKTIDFDLTFDVEVIPLPAKSE